MVANGCSGGIDWLANKLLGHSIGFTGCCNKHDVAYEKGGGYFDRLRADKELFICVKEHLRQRKRPVHPAYFIYIGVRVAGWKFWQSR